MITLVKSLHSDFTIRYSAVPNSSQSFLFRVYDRSQLMSQPGQGHCEEVSGRPINSWASWWLRADLWPLLLVAIALMLGYVWAYRLPNVAMVAWFYYSDFYFSFFLLGLFAVGRVIQITVRNAYEARLGLRYPHRSRRWFWFWLFAIAGGTHLTVWSGAPVHFAFLLSRPALDRLADEALEDPANVDRLAGRRAGLYRIDGVEVIGSTVVFYLDESGNYGFARVPEAATDEILNHRGLKHLPEYYPDFPEDGLSKQGFVDPHGKRIKGDWFVVYSYYKLIKVGWS